MKKTLSLLAVATLFTVSGCSDATANISDPNTSLINVAGTDITKGDIYNSLKVANGGAMTLSLVQNEIYQKEVPLTDEMKKAADEQMAEIKKSVSGDFLEALKKAGFENEEDYKKKSIYPSLQSAELNKKYISENQKTVFNNYHPVKAQIFVSTDKAKAESALKDLKEGKDFKETTKKYGTTTTYDGSEKVYHSQSGLPTATYDKIKAATKPGLLDTIIEDSATKSYYLVNVTNTDPTSFEKDAIEAITTTGGETLTSTTMASYLEKYKFNVYDIDVYNQIKTNAPTYLTQK